MLKNVLYSTMGRGLGVLFLWMYLCNTGVAQSFDEVDLRGYFAVDSCLLGVPAPYILVTCYPIKQPVIFIDSTYDFSPFEWSSMRYYPSQIRGNRMCDSVVYYLSPFSLAPVQRLQLPIYQMVNGTRQVRYTAIDSLVITGLIPPAQGAEEAKLKGYVAYQTVPLAFNYTFFFILLGAGVGVGVWLYFLCRRPVRKWWRKRTLTRHYVHFEEEFSACCHTFQQTQALSQVVYALRTWKGYLEQLEHKPYRKLSTEEICALPEHTSLGKHLRPLDNAIYANRGKENSLPCLQELARIARQRYYDKLIQVHG